MLGLAGSVSLTVAVIVICLIIVFVLCRWVGEMIHRMFVAKTLLNFIDKVTTGNPQGDMQVSYVIIYRGFCFHAMGRKFGLVLSQAPFVRSL